MKPTKSVLLGVCFSIIDLSTKYCGAQSVFQNPPIEAISCYTYAKSMSLPLPSGQDDLLVWLCNDPELQAKIQALSPVAADTSTAIYTISGIRALASYLERIRVDLNRLVLRQNQVLRICRQEEHGVRCFNADLNAKAALQAKLLELRTIKDQVDGGIRFVSCAPSASCIKANGATSLMLQKNLEKLDVEVTKTLTSLTGVLDTLYATTFVIE